MKFVQIGREVLPRLVSNRTEKGVIVDIKNSLFVIILKQNRTREIIRLKDVVLTDRVYTKEELADVNCDFYKVIEKSKVTNDFERYLSALRQDIVSKMVKESGF